MVVIGTRGAKAARLAGVRRGHEARGHHRRPHHDAVDRRRHARCRASAPAHVKDTGTFEIEGLIGARLFRAGNLPKGWFLKRVTVNGQDVTDKGLEFKPGEDVERDRDRADQPVDVASAVRSPTTRAQPQQGIHRRHLQRRRVEVGADREPLAVVGAAGPGRPLPLQRPAAGHLLRRRDGLRAGG